jgi:hypothetical protein
MPNVGSNDFKAARGVNDFVPGIPYGKDGTTGGPNNDGWKYGYAVYAHNGTTWVEVWNARPEMVSSTFTVSNSTTLSFSGTADPNNFATTATFEYREVGGTYADANTTTTGLGNNVDGAVSFSLTKTSIDGFKNWEARAKGTNIAGSGLGAVLSRDCRKSPTVVWGESPVDNATTGTCNNRTYTITTTYTREGCPTYSVTSSPIPTTADCSAACYGEATVTEEYFDGTCNSIRYRTKTVTNPVAGSNCPSTTTYGDPYAAPDCTGCTGTPYVSNSCSGCGSITTTPGTGGCPDSTSGSCGTWSDSGGLGQFLGTVSLVSGSYPYATYYFSTGNWYYTDAAGNICNCGCPSGKYIAPGWIDICDQGGYRSSGADRCID